jgi:hypothetical protein
MIEPRKQSGVAFWAPLVLVVVLVVYLLSIGPACCFLALKDRHGAHWNPAFDGLYWPIGWCAADGRGSANRALKWYVRLWLPADSQVWIPDGRSVVLENGVRGAAGFWVSNQYTPGPIGIPIRAD